MRPLALFAILALAACSADQSGQQPVWDDPYDQPEDDWSDPAADDFTQDGDDDTQDDDVQDTEDDEIVPPEDNGPAHHDEVEPNDDAETPTYIGTPDCSADAALEGTDDNDWFSVSIEEPGPYVFLTSTGDLDDDQATDTRMEVFGRDDLETALGSDDDAGEGSASRLGLDLPVGTFYIRVIGYNTATVGDYTIHVVHEDSDLGNDDPTDDDDGDDDEDEELSVPEAQEVETESNGTLDSADSLGDGPWTIAANLDARDVDHFVFLVDDATFVTVETGRTDPDDNAVDTFMEVLDADGRVLGEDDDGSDEPMFSLLTVDLPEAGLYYVRVTGYSESTHGSYSLSIE